jgi:hypothetical protein
MNRRKAPMLRQRPADGDTSRWTGLLTKLAFFILIGVATARAMMLESLRDVTPVIPGAAGAPRGPGAAASLVLDLLCCAPALLILIRQAIDRSYRIRLTPAHLAFGALAILAVLSTAWSADKFAAIVSASHLVAAAAVFFAASQVVKDWVNFRLIAAMCLGLLLVYTAHGLIHHFLDVPDNVRYWQEHKAEELAQRGWTAGSFEARQFEQKLLRGEMIGFNASPNTFAAMMVLCGIVAAGIGIQRIRHRDEWGWPTAIFAALPPAALVMWYTHSNAAMVTPILAGLILVALARWRGWIAEHRKLCYWVVVACILFGGLAVVGHGIHYGTLPTDSMRFRWRYWSASMRIVQAHPWIGVGWNQFGLHYLAVRAAAAAEEIRDPHNLFVRVLVELGAIGAVLLIGWLLRAAWETTAACAIAPSTQAAAPVHGRWVAFHTLVGLTAVAMVINIASSIDFAQPGDWVALELLRRALFAGLLLLGYAVATLRSSKLVILDDRPAPCIRYGIVIGLAMFLLHNTIDFSLFENGPLIVFISLAGGLTGICTPRDSTARARPALARGALAAVVLLLAAATVLLVIPVCRAEAAAHEGDDAIRAGKVAEGALALTRAMDLSPAPNADYALRAAQACSALPGSDEKVLALLERAVQANPLDPAPLLFRARFLLQRHPQEQKMIRGDFTRAIELDPNNVGVRIEFARALERAGDSAVARQQYRRALELDDQLDPAEPKRLSASQRQALLDKL